jgi:hypothetical protein
VRRILVTVVCASVLAAGCGGDDEQPASPSAQPVLADLSVRVDPDGTGAEKPRSAAVNCGAPDDSKLCGVVAGLTAESFAPTGGQMACTQQFGGPETAIVTGTFRGQEVNARFSRENGCEISRWEKVAELLGAAG